MKTMRDAKLVKIYQGTNQIQRLVIARELLDEQSPAGPRQTPPGPGNPANTPSPQGNPHKHAEQCLIQCGFVQSDAGGLVPPAALATGESGVAGQLTDKREYENHLQHRVEETSSL